MSLDVAKIRADYDCLQGGAAAPIYLDSACMTLKPNRVLDAMMSYYREHPSCHKRAVHKFGAATTKAVDQARKLVAKGFNADPKDSHVIFLRNTTEAINLVANGFPFREGDRVLTSGAEHNSNLLPWQFLSKKKRIVHETFAVPVDAELGDLRELKEKLAKGGVKLVSVFHTSHVTGMSLPIREIAELAHQHGALLLVDGAQGLAHGRLDVEALGADFLAVSFHKAFGPTGMGALYGRVDALKKLSPMLVGGETVEDADYQGCTMSPMPAMFEAGLQDYAGIIGSAEAVRYLESLGHENIRQHERTLNALFTEQLRGIPGMKILGPADPAKRNGVLNLSIQGIDAGELSILLDRTTNIMARTGVHCCHAWYRANKLAPSLRLSLSVYNTAAEAETVGVTLRRIMKHFV